MGRARSPARDGNLVIKPPIGIANGALLSGGVRDDVTDLPTDTGGNFFEGIVPSPTMNCSGDAFEAEYYGGCYAAVRNRNDPGAADFLRTWVNAGAKIGPKFSTDNGFFARFTSGADIEDGHDGDFYRLTAEFSF